MKINSKAIAFTLLGITFLVMGFSYWPLPFPFSLIFCGTGGFIVGRNITQICK